MFDDDSAVSQRGIDLDIKWIAFAMVFGRCFDRDAAPENRFADGFQFLNPGFNCFSNIRDRSHISKRDLSRKNHDAPLSKISSHKKGSLPSPEGRGCREA